jgi:putative ABC transport system ATP-binding protein
VRLDRATRTYRTATGTVRAIVDVSLEIAPGSSVGIMGPSGCGKSTLLSLIGGLEQASAGAVRLGDHDLSSLGRRARAALRRHSVGFVFQRDNLLPFLTAAENVALQLALGEPTHRTSSPAELLAGVGLGRKTDKLPDQLSGGERQRVAIASALAHSPSVVLADEPTGSLDDTNADMVLGLLVAAQRDTGATLVVVSHDPDVCGRLGRTITLFDGRIVDDVAILEHADGR